MTPEQKSWYKFTNAASGSPASLVIEGDIGGWDVSSKQFRSDFGRIGADEPVNIHIMSGGGSIIEGNEIANIIKAHKGTVTVTLGSICASIATVIACAGDKVIAASNTLFMIHNPSVYADGDAKQMRKMADIMDKMKKSIIAAYVEKTKLSEEKLEAMMDDAEWMLPEEALENGFVDEVTKDAADDDVLDNVDLSRYQNAFQLLSRLQPNAPNGAANTGNGTKLTLQAIRNAAAQTNKPVTEPSKPATTKPTQPANQLPTMTPEEIEAANKKAIAEGVKNAREAERKRKIEVLATVKQEKTRTGIDFTDEATLFLDGEEPADKFFSIILASTKKAKPVVGAGAELIEPLDGYKGTPGYAFVNSENFKALQESIKGGGRRPQGAIQLQIHVPEFRNVHTSTATSGSGLTSIQKLPGVVELGVRPLTVEDVIADGSTDATTVRYIQEVTYTEAATTVAETGALPELAMTYTETDAGVKDIGGYVKMSENLLADYAGVASFINQRLPYQVDRAVEDQLLNGDGTGTNITGILATAGIQTLALGANSRPDLALKLQTLVRWQNMTAGQAQGGFEPDAYIVHPTDWETLVLTKDANGQYLCRGPFVGSYGIGTALANVEFYTLWGKKVVITPVTAQGTIVCGAWYMGAQKFNRAGLIIEMTNSDGSDFLSRKITVRGTRRLALCVYRPGSFVQGTGL